MIRAIVRFAFYTLVVLAAMIVPGILAEALYQLVTNN